MTGRAVTVVIPTFNRPDGLERAVRSLFAQDCLGSVTATLVIADNSRDANARQTVECLTTEAPAGLNLLYVSVPAPGVATARNVAMEHVSTDLVAFLDDDQSASPGWLAAMLESHRAYPAAVTFGATPAALPDHITRHRAYFEDFFGREPKLDDGYTEHSFGCGNSLLDLSRIGPERPLFDERTNRSGGEDDLLYERVRREGGRFAWSNGAVAFEHPAEKRVRLSYTLRRAFSYGQGPCTLARRKEPTDYGALAFWMSVGAAKFTLNMAKYFALWIVRHPNRVFALDAAVRGLGKVFFWVGFEFYGAAEPRSVRKARRRKAKAGGAAVGGHGRETLL